MRAIVYEEFAGPISVREVTAPEPGSDEVVIRVMASGVCRSDWHGWRGHDPDIDTLPHVPGHEMAGVIASVGTNVQGFQVDDRVVVPFVAGCGHCESCLGGDPQVCPNQSQPGFTHWGSFAEYVVVRYASGNLVKLPDEVDFVTAASLGCRFMTAWRAVVDQGRAQRNELVAVHGCGGVGLSAVMIARSIGASVIAIDPNPEARDLANQLGATSTLEPHAALADEIVELTGGGAHLSLDAIGNPDVLETSVASLRRRGRHVQVGLLLGDHSRPPVQIDRLISRELEIIGSHGASSSDLQAIVEKVKTGDLDPRRLVTARLSLEEGADYLSQMGSASAAGVAVIDRF